MSELRTPRSHPTHAVVGHYWAGHSTLTGQVTVYYCDSYDPAIGFYMSCIYNPADRKNVSERAIGRAFHEAYREESNFHCYAWNTRYPFTSGYHGVGVLLHVGDYLWMRVRQGRECQNGLWESPGGTVELNEAARMAALRETLEETGIDLQAEEHRHKLFRFLRTSPHSKEVDGKTIDYLTHWYQVGLKPGDRPQDTEKKGAWMAVSFADCEQLPLMPGLLEVVRSLKTLPAPGPYDFT